MVKKSRIITLVITAAVLAVVTSGNALAYTWNGQTDASRYNSGVTIDWISWIDNQGTASVGQTLSWGNSLANNCGSPEVPAVSYFEGLDGSWNPNKVVDKRSSGAISSGSYWAVFDYSQKTVKSYSIPSIIVSHEAYNTGGSLLASSTGKTQPFTIV